MKDYETEVPVESEDQKEKATEENLLLMNGVTGDRKGTLKVNGGLKARCKSTEL